MLKTIGLIAGHYECRSLAETLPVFTDLLAMEIVERKAGRSHDQTSQHRLAPDRPRRRPRRAGENLRQPLRLSRRHAHRKSKPRGNMSKRTKTSITSARLPNRRAPTSPTRFIFTSPAAIIWRSSITIPAAHCTGARIRRAIGKITLTSERFPGRGYVPQAFTHGTLQCDDVERSRRFYVEVLGLEIAAGFNTAQYIKHPAAPWYLVVLQRSPRQYLAPVNRFTLQLGSAAEVEQAHREFVSQQEFTGPKRNRRHRPRRRHSQFHLQRSRQKLVGTHRQRLIP